MHKLAKLDHLYVWHPFTQMRDWLREEPIVIVRGRGPFIYDVYGRKYLDGNSSIWTNLHGHNHPVINKAIMAQLKKIAHSSALGLANEPASLLAKELVRIANSPIEKFRVHRKSTKPLCKVFYSDDGSTSIEVALKMAYEFARRSGLNKQPRFLSLSQAYHGDTIGAVSLGHIPLFHAAFRGLTFRTDAVMSPYCYRCRFNRAKPERADARLYRQCHWECVDEVERAFENAKKQGRPYSAFVLEPLIQGAAGMVPQPRGWLRKIAEITRHYSALLIADEVLTGFGRCGFPEEWFDCQPGQLKDYLLACHHEDVMPDLLCLAKGITGGYLPMAATLTTMEIFEAFLGEYSEFKTFFHGHSYTANQLGAAAALANIALLDKKESRHQRAKLQLALQKELSRLWNNQHVGDIRQVGLIAGVELVKDWHTRELFDLRDQVGFRVCRAMAKRGVLTRPIGDVIVIMPPYCTTADQVSHIIDALEESITEVLSE